MKRWARILLRNCWFGLAFSTLTLVGSAIYTWIAGPLFGRMNVAATSFMFLVFGTLGLAGVVAFLRQPNPYSRTYALYDLNDLPERHDELDSGGDGWLWQVAPMVVVGAILLPFFA